MLAAVRHEDHLDATGGRAISKLLLQCDSDETVGTKMWAQDVFERSLAPFGVESSAPVAGCRAKPASRTDSGASITMSGRPAKPRSAGCCRANVEGDVAPSLKVTLGAGAGDLQGISPHRYSRVDAAASTVVRF